MAKIVIIGAGSHVFSRHLVTDIISFPELRDSTINLMDIDTESLDLITAFTRKLVKQQNFNTKIESTTDLSEALKGADYVITTIRVGGLQASQVEREIAAKYGIIECVGDTLGPGGIFYGLRNVPVMLDICHHMEKLCRDAWLMNYTNPMSILCWAVNDYTCIKNVGLCHSVQHTATQLANYLSVPYEELDCWVAGINHMAWFLKLTWGGEDAYPLLREKFKKPRTYLKPGWDLRGTEADIVRAEIFKAFGYYVTESSDHMSEYVPYFRKKNRPELLEKFKVRRLTNFKEKREMRRTEDEELKRQISSIEKLPINHSGEYGSIIIHSIETGKTSRINANVKNNGVITNLPKGCCVEVPCIVDKEGISPCYVGDLPPQLSALNRTNINVQELAVRGIVEKDKTKIFHSVLLDPLTSAALTIDETRRMVNEMFKAEEKYLKGFK
jgi:alpha-galactosidase